MTRQTAAPVLAACALALFAAAAGAASFWDRLLEAPAPRSDGWAGSDTCDGCHRDQHRTWHRSYHRTMTQEATPKTVAGPFDGRIVNYWGQPVRLVREGERFFFEYLDENSGKPYKRLPVERTVGSHRYQQYLTRHRDAGVGNYWRLPLLWHIQEERWVHVNGVFLGSDDQDFDNHLTMWNQNCIFCHNTGPVPNIQNMDELLAKGAQGEPVDFRYEPRYRSRVAELGIACESCHSPGARHAEENRNPLRRYFLHLSGRDDPTIVHPAKLDHRRSAAICGQCHAQRLPEPRESIRDWLDDGPTYRAGDRLTDHVRPIRIDTPPADPSNPDQFRLRFWTDGTPRLSAYEYQGLTMSKCFTDGELTCISCHEGHGGDPAGMIRPENRTGAACAGCHQQLVDDPVPHTRHAADSAGSNCYNCHMPYLAYGVMTIHRSHNIEVPDPGKQAADQRPDACTNCHVDRSVAWAERRTAELWGHPTDPASADREMPRLVEHLLTGDPVQRAIAARLAGEPGHPDAEREYLVPFLIMTLSDRYPMLRWFARKSLLSLAQMMAEDPLFAGLEAWDYIAPESTRQAFVDTLWTRWARMDKSGIIVPHGLPLDDNLMPERARVEQLTAQRKNREIEIGE